MSGERILVVDDEHMVRQACVQTLTGEGYEVREASAGQEALSCLEEEQIDLLLVDLKMAEMDGLTLLRQAREMDPTLAAVIVTGHGTMENAIEALSTGARGFLLKPFQPAGLLATVDAALEARRWELETTFLRVQLPILEIGQTLMAEGDTASLPGRLLEVVARQMRAERALLMLLDEEEGMLQAVGAIGLTSDGADRMRVPLDDGLTGRALSQGDPFPLDGGFSHDPIVQAMTAGRHTAVVYTPLRSRARAIGALVLGREKQAGGRRTAAFPPSDLNLLSIIAGQIAVSLENAQLYEWTQRELVERKQAEEALARQADRLALINEIGGRIAAVLALDRVADTAARLVQEKFGYHHVALWTLDRQEGVLVMKARAGAVKGPFPPDHRLKLSQGLVGWVGLHGKTQLANDIRNEPRYVNRYPEAISTRSELAVPIQVGGETVGVLDVQSPQPHAFDQSDVMVLETIANQIAVAIENARLYEAVRRELAERQRAEEELRESEERYRQLFEDSPVSLWEEDLSDVKKHLDRLGDEGIRDIRTYLAHHPEVVAECAKMAHVLEVNRATMELYQVESKDTLRGDLSQAFAPESYEAFREELVAIAEGKTCFESETIAETLAGGRKHTILRWSVAPGHEDTLKKVLVSIVDISERKQMEQTMLRIERLAAMGHLAAALAHEINNPLQSIGNSMELVLDFPLEEDERQDYLEAVRQEINRLMTLTSRVLDFARPPRVERQPTSLAKAVRYALTLADRQMAHTGIEISADLPDSLPPVLASHDQLAQVFLNLIINAIDAMRDGGRLDITARSTAEQIELTFADSGPGIPPENLDKLFEPFHTTKKEGTGLGLALSYSIVQQHGGTIRGGNAPGGGAVFAISLPLAPAGDRHQV